MINWKHRFKIKDLLSDVDLPPEKVQKLGREVAQRLEAVTFPFDFLDLANDFRYVNDQEDFNNCLEELYDLADDQRIWIE